MYQCIISLKRNKVKKCTRIMLSLHGNQFIIFTALRFFFYSRSHLMLKNFLLWFLSWFHSRNIFMFILSACKQLQFSGPQNTDYFLAESSNANANICSHLLWFRSILGWLIIYSKCFFLHLNFFFFFCHGTFMGSMLTPDFCEVFESFLFVVLLLKTFIVSKDNYFS